MVFGGGNLHKHTITLAVVDAARKRLARKRFSNLQSEAIVTFLKTLGPFQLVWSKRPPVTSGSCSWSSRMPGGSCWHIRGSCG